MKFQFGRLTATKTVANLMKSNKVFGEFVSDSLKRYGDCDWGSLCDEDKARNDAAIKSGEDGLLAEYRIPDAISKETCLNMFGVPEEKIWIITEWDHSVTTILFPSER